MTLKALIFDVDGTLSNTETDGHLVAFNQAFAQVGLDWIWSHELYHDLLSIAGGKERIKYYIMRDLPRFDYQPYLINLSENRTLEEWIADIHQLKTQIFINLSHTGKMPLRIGVKRLLDEALEQGLTLAIATTTTLANVVALISSTLGEKYLDNFAVIAAGNDAKHKKPDGEIYTYALNKLGFNANECLAFEDSDNGILSATKSGLKTIITTNEYTHNHLFKGALLILDQLGDTNHCIVVKGGQAITEINNDTFVNINLLKRIHEKYCQ